MNRFCDVLVVGLGPGGGAAAWAAASRGLRVIAIERKAQIGVPVQCAEFIPIPIGRYARAQGVAQQQIEGMRTVLPSGEVQRSELAGLMIDRAAFDQGLAAMAAEAGAQILVRATLEGLRADDDVALVRDAAGTHEIRYHLLIAADGPYSKVAESKGLPRQKMVYSRQYTVPLLHEVKDTMIWLSGEYPGGYAWLFPRGKEANLGIGIDFKYERDVKHPLDKLHEQLVADGVVGPTISRRTGGAIPVGGMRSKLTLGNILFVGDAAGLTHPITGAGIAAAVMSGERAGEAVAEWTRKGQAALDEYEEDMRDQYGPTIERALKVRASLEWVWKTPEADTDAGQRRGWIAFEEYFAF